MPKFVSGSSGNLYARDKSSTKKEDEDEILAVISNQTAHDYDTKKPSAVNKKGAKEKQKSSLDLFKEELRRLNEERDEQRNKLKHSLDASSTQSNSSPNISQLKQPVQPVPLPLRPDPRCPTALTLKVNLNPKEKDGPSMGSFDTGDPTTTNLYVGNLNPIATENDLCDIFGKFGPLASIKIMWPRTEEERARKRNSGFVAYMSRVDADRALKTLTGMEFRGYEMKLGWGKAVPLPKDPVFIPQELHDLLRPPTKTGMPFNAQLHESDQVRGYQVPNPLPRPPVQSESQTETEREFFDVQERSSVYVHVPQDRKMLDRIHKTIEYCLREGPVFEAIIIARESKNEQYRFLYEHQSPEHVYYRWKLYSLLHGEDPHQWHTEPFKMFIGGSWWKPPPLNPYAEGMPIELVEKLTGISREILANGRSAGDLSRKMEIFNELTPSNGGSMLKFRGKFGEMKVSVLNDMLTRLLPTKSSVGFAMLFCINHSDAAEEIIGHVEKAISDDSTSIATKIAQLFLISDILHNSSAAVTNASFYQRGFQVKLAEIFKRIRDYRLKIDDQQKSERLKQQVMSVISSWNYFHIYESKFLSELSDIFLGPTHSGSGEPREELPSSEQANSDQDKQTESLPLDDQLDGEPIDDSLLAECLEVRGLSLRWYKTLELSDDEMDDADAPEGHRAGSSKPSESPSTPNASDKLEERVRFKTSKWELVNQEEEEQRSLAAGLDPIRPSTASELMKQQMQKQEALSSADEYESLASSSESND